MIGFSILYAISAFWQIKLLSALSTKYALAPGSEYGIESIQDIIGLGQGLINLTAVVTFLMWMYKSHSILEALGAKTLEYSPGWTIAAFIVPFYSIVRPFQVMSEIWRASDPNRDDQQSWRWENPPRILRWWWGFVLLRVVVQTILSKLEPNLAVVNYVGQMITHNYWSIASELIEIAAAIAAIQAIGSIRDRQTEGLKRLPVATQIPVPPPLPEQA